VSTLIQVFEKQKLLCLEWLQKLRDNLRALFLSSSVASFIGTLLVTILSSPPIAGLDLSVGFEAACKAGQGLLYIAQKYRSGLEGESSLANLTQLGVQTVIQELANPHAQGH
jgi:hypothetical protein